MAFNSLTQMLSDKNLFETEKIFDEESELEIVNNTDAFVERDVFDCMINSIIEKGGKESLLEEFEKAKRIILSGIPSI